MARIIIKNVGPVKEVDIELNKVNVFMGPQGSGKSTIAKIVSHCSWFEKNIILKNMSEKSFYKDLLTFHNLEDTYFNESSVIRYESDCFTLDFAGKDKSPVIQVLLGEGRKFKNRKIEYIPAERNFVSAIPGLGKYNETNNNILNFLYDWFQAKQDLDESSSFEMPLTSLDASFYYTRENDTDHICLKNGKEITLQHSSSGFQSLTPLLVVFNYMLNTIYTKERTKTPFEVVNGLERIKGLDKEDVERLLKLVAAVQESEKNPVLIGNSGAYTLYERINNVLGIYSDYYYSSIIIEEPEQNSFPLTQRDLVYYLLKSLNSTEREHQLLLTTHSPYILYALNNCMLSYLVKDELTEAEKEKLLSYSSRIDPVQVSAWEINKKGQLTDIKNSRLGTIGEHYFNSIMNEVMDEYYIMLKHIKRNK